MIRPTSLFLIVVSIGLGSCTIKMYCPRSDELCAGTGKKHVTCGATGTIQPSCPAGAYGVGLSDTNIQQILDLHNKYRNQLAGGNVAGFSPATKMNTVVCYFIKNCMFCFLTVPINISQKWNQDLADYAGLNTLTCQYGHDCHVTPEFKFSGQSIFEQTIIGNSVTYKDVPDFIEQAINKWWSEKDMASQDVIDNCCGTNSDIFHFLAIAADRINQIGCAISHFPEGEQGKKSYIVCNYSFQPFGNQPTYVKGAPTSQCQSGSNPNYPSLCSESEVVDNNKPFN
jgi:Cysteine-rich secretory protein family